MQWLGCLCYPLRASCINTPQTNKNVQRELFLATRSNIVSFDDAKRGRASARSDSSVTAPRGARAQSSAERGSNGQAGRTSRSSSNGAKKTSKAASSSREKAVRGGTRTTAAGARGPKDSGRPARSSRTGTTGKRTEEAPRRGTTSSRGKTAGRGTAASAQDNKAFFDDLAERHQKKKRANAKERADRQFDRTYGKADRAKATPEEAGPRAALYKGEMGRSHKRSSESLNKDGRAAKSAKGGIAAEPRKGGWKRHLARLGAAVACVALACVVLYDPARMYYQEIREVARLQAEYDAIVARNDSLQASVDHLSTEAGVADEAREQLGWVSPGENAVNVSGLEDKESGFQANVVSDQVKPPETWYSSILDPFFGVE